VEQSADEPQYCNVLEGSLQVSVKTCLAYSH